MTMVGDSSDWADFFPEGLIPDVIQLILDTWKRFRKPKDKELEPSITKRFGRALDSQNTKFQAVPVVIVTEVDGVGNVPGQIDFKIVGGRRASVYFGLEAKKLRILSGKSRRSNADQYAGEEGMMRFISGKYSPQQEHAGMLGYVMDGDCKKAHQAIKKRIEKQLAELKMGAKDTMHQASAFKAHSVYETIHRLKKRKLTLHHILLGA